MFTLGIMVFTAPIVYGMVRLFDTAKRIFKSPSPSPQQLVSIKVIPRNFTSTTHEEITEKKFTTNLTTVSNYQKPHVEVVSVYDSSKALTLHKQHIQNNITLPSRDLFAHKTYPETYTYYSTQHIKRLHIQNYIEKQPPRITIKLPKIFYVYLNGDVCPTLPKDTKKIIVPNLDQEIILPWFCTINNEVIMRRFDLPELKQNALNIMTELPKNVHIDTYFNICILNAARKLIKEKYDSSVVIMITYFSFPHAKILNTLVYVAKHLKEFRLRKLNILPILSEKNKALVTNELYLKDVKLTDLTKIPEALSFLKLNRHFLLQIYPRTGKETLKNIWNHTPNYNPDGVIMLKDKINNVSGVAFDCKAMEEKPVNEKNIIRIVHNELHLENVSKSAHEILIFQLEKHVESAKNVEELNQITLYLKELRDNLKNFAETGNLENFVSNFSVLFSKNLALIVEKKIPVTLTEILNVEDLNTNYIKDIQMRFLSYLSKEFSTESNIFKRTCYFASDYEETTVITTTETKMTLDILFNDI